MSDHEIDTRRLLCPIPVIRTQDKIKTLEDGDLLTVACTDPGVTSDSSLVPDPWSRDYQYAHRGT